MEFFTAFIYIITCFGICTILIDSIGPWHIFVKWHNWMSKHTPMLDELFSCYVCLPTWIGATFSAVNYIFMPTLAFTPFNMLLGGTVTWWLIIPLDAFFTSGGVWLIHTIQRAVEKYADE